MWLPGGANTSSGRTAHTRTSRGDLAASRIVCPDDDGFVPVTGYETGIPLASTDVHDADDDLGVLAFTLDSGG